VLRLVNACADVGVVRWSGSGPRLPEFFSEGLFGKVTGSSVAPSMVSAILFFALRIFK